MRLTIFDVDVDDLTIKKAVIICWDGREERIRVVKSKARCYGNKKNVFCFSLRCIKEDREDR